MIEISWVSPTRIEWECVVCHLKIESEEMQGWRDAQGNPATLYSPSSRYWLPGSKPALTAGVFCGPECAKIHGDIVKELFS